MAEEDGAEPPRQPTATADKAKPAPAADWDTVGHDLFERYAGILAQLPD